MKKIFIVVLIVIIIAVGFLSKIYLIGQVERVNGIAVHRCVLTGSKISLNADILGDSALSYKNYTYQMKNNTVTIQIHSVLRSYIHPSGKINIALQGDFKGIKQVCLSDQKANKILIKR